jgi:hypothetical protein
MTPFKKGDPVVALKTITRQDHRCLLRVGESATIRDVFTTNDGTQIVSILMPDGDIMIDIVIFEIDPPLKHK